MNGEDPFDEDYQDPFDEEDEELFDVKESPLSQTVERDGQSLDIDIYDVGDGKWILEVVDEFGNSTVWDDPFDTDEMALEEALRTIKQEGILSLIDFPPDS